MADKIIGINLNGVDYDYEDEETFRQAEENASAIGDLASLATTVKTDLVSAINEIAEAEESYTVVYFYTGVVKDESVTNPRNTQILAYLDNRFPSKEAAQPLYKEILKTLYQKNNGKPYTLYSSNIDGGYGGSVNFCLSGSVGMTQKGTYTDDEDNPGSAEELVTQSISVSFSSATVALRIVELPANGGVPIYITAVYRAQDDTCTIYTDNTSTPPYLGLIVAN